MKLKYIVVYENNREGLILDIAGSRPGCSCNNKIKMFMNIVLLERFYEFLESV